MDVLRALGARVVRTPAVGKVNSLDSHIARAYKLQSEIPGSVVLDQVRKQSGDVFAGRISHSTALSHCRVYSIQSSHQNRMWMRPYFSDYLSLFCFFFSWCITSLNYKIDI